MRYEGLLVQLERRYRDTRSERARRHYESFFRAIACASCHIDGKMDRLAWDLGDPTGLMDIVIVAAHNMGMGLTFLDDGFLTSIFSTPWDDSHPMKGPMTTQTLQDIIGKEPLHWRGDRQGIESFNGAFVGLNGDDVRLTNAEMQEFEDFLSTIWIPPNPFRNLDNSLPSSVELPGQVTDGEFGDAGQQLAPGDPRRGLRLYMGTEAPNFFMDGAVNCVTCHSLPIGNGADSKLNATNTAFDAIPVGPLGNHHIGMNSTDLSTNIAIKIPQLRTGVDKAGFSKFSTRSRAGFGYFHDGAVDSLASFLSAPVFDVRSNQDISDIVALMFAFSGSDFGDLPQNPPVLFDADDNFPVILLPFVSEPPSMQTSKDTHAAVGQQVTINSASDSLARINDFIDIAATGAVELVAHGAQDGERRGWRHLTGASSEDPIFQSDLEGETIEYADLVNLSGAGSELTFTVVHDGSGQRLALDRDRDMHFDFDEHLALSDPADPASVPSALILLDPTSLSITINEGDAASSQVFGISNSGLGRLNYSISDNAAWLFPSPLSGSSTGETDIINLNFVTPSLPAGVFTGLITISDSRALNTDQVLTVTLTVEGAGGPTTGTSGSSGGGCFIATATYGTPMAQEINVLRGVRDAYLLDTALGTAFVDTYYRMSPPFADLVARSPFLAALVRAVLIPIVAASTAALNAPGLSLSALACMLIAALYTHRRRHKTGVARKIL